MNQDSRVEMSTFTGKNRDRFEINLVCMSQDMFRNFRVYSFYIPDCCPACVHQPLFVAVCPTDPLVSKQRACSLCSQMTTETGDPMSEMSRDKALLNNVLQTPDDKTLPGREDNR